jgi:hypothetical protein
MFYTQESFHIRRKQKDECIHNSNKIAYFLKLDWFGVLEWEPVF